MFRATELAGPVEVVAPRLLGATLMRSDGRAGVIIEVEAYGGADDPASHAFRGRRARNATMFGPAGRLYVYRSYGVHWCANVVTGADGEPAAVLIRALRPTRGVAAMRAARWGDSPRGALKDLCSGPGRLTQAFGIDGAFDGVDLCDPLGDLRLLHEDAPDLLLQDPLAVQDPVATPRIGISKATDRLWRFVVPQPRADLLR